MLCTSAIELSHTYYITRLESNVHNEESFYRGRTRTAPIPLRNTTHTNQNNVGTTDCATYYSCTSAQAQDFGVQGALTAPSAPTPSPRKHASYRSPVCPRLRAAAVFSANSCAVYFVCRDRIGWMAIAHV